MRSSQIASHVDVLIVGAGPAGLMSAIALAQAGVKVKIVDQRPSSVAAGQADGIMPRTIELFKSYGMAEPLLKQACQINMVAFYNSGKAGGIKRTGRLPMINSPDARYQFAVSLNQGAIETILIDKLSTFGVFVDRPVRPSSLILSADEEKLNDPDAYPVNVVLEHLNTDEIKEEVPEVVFAKYAIGADGAHSWVRKSLGIIMEGEQTDHVWGAVDITITPESDFPDWRNICTINAANTTIMSIPREGNKMRLYLDLGLEHGIVDASTGRVTAQNVDSKRLLEIAKAAVQPYTLEPERIDWWTVYVVGQRVAARFSAKERVFIAGDACHTHSPKGGQGMNVSMNDGHNLGWKLAYVIHGRADVALLRTYEFERRKFAQELIAFDKWYEAGFSVKDRSEIFKESDTMTPLVEPFEAFRAFSGLTSGLGIHYESSIITSSKEASGLALLVVGQRLLPQIVLYAADFTPVNIQDVCPSDSRFKLLIFAGDILQTSQLDRLRRFSDQLFAKPGIICKFGPAVFHAVTVLKGEKETVDYFGVPLSLRADWKTVLLDATDATGTRGGQLYQTYGVSTEGAVIVVRPDGYISLVVGLDEVKEIEKYFSGFLKF